MNTNDEDEGEFGPKARFSQPGGICPTGCECENGGGIGIQLGVPPFGLSESFVWLGEERGQGTPLWEASAARSRSGSSRANFSTASGEGMWATYFSENARQWSFRLVATFRKEAAKSSFPFSGLCAIP